MQQLLSKDRSSVQNAKMDRTEICNLRMFRSRHTDMLRQAFLHSHDTCLGYGMQALVSTWPYSMGRHLAAMSHKQGVGCGGCASAGVGSLSTLSKACTIGLCAVPDEVHVV